MGDAWHRKQFTEHPELLVWVLSEHHFGENGQIPEIED